MSKFKDITGQKFGKLTVIKRIENNKGRTVWLCKCDCGKLHKTNSNYLISGGTKSCGCGRYIRGKANPLFKDITGQKFGKLTAIKYVSGNKQRNTIWECRCDCGKMHEVSSTALVSGGTKSCGCSHYRCGKSSPLFKDISGQVFNRLTAIEYVEKNKQGTIWLFKCECGKMVKARSGDLIQGKIKSCGCLNHRRGNLSPRFIGYEEISGTFWNSIQNNAMSRNISFEISIEYAWNLFIKQNKKCAITGWSIGFNKRLKDRDGTASLDRIDSKKGYIEGNVQWVHKYINNMKLDHTQEEFIKMCCAVADHYRKTLAST